MVVDIQTLAVSGTGVIVTFCRRLLAYVHEAVQVSSFVYLYKDSLDLRNAR